MNQVRAWGDTPWPEETAKRQQPLYGTKPLRKFKNKTAADRSGYDAAIRGKFKEAIDVAKLELQKALYPESIESCKKKLGHAFADAKKFDKALAQFQGIENWRQKANIVQAVAIILSRKGDHKAALDVLDDNWQDDDSMRCCKARIFSRLRQYDKAIAILETCHTLYKEDSATFALARCYEDKGSYEKAIEIYRKISHYNPAKTLENMGRCYANMKQLEMAESAFEKLVSMYPEPHYFVPFGRVYQDFGLYDKAVSTFKRYPDWQNSIKLLMAIGCCLEQAGLYDEAIEVFKQIQNWEENNPVIMSYGRCLEKKKEYVQAEEVFKWVKGWESNVNVLLCLSRVRMFNLEAQGMLKECHKEVCAYIERIPDWRENTQALVAMIWLSLRACIEVRVLYFLHDALLRFPDVVDFYRLQSLYYSLNNDFEEGIPFVLKATERFPGDRVLALRLLEFYLRARDGDSAKVVENTLRNRHADDKDFIDGIEQTIRRFAIKEKRKERQKYVTLPPEITRIFQDVGQDKIVLVGSTVLNLLTGDWKSLDDRDIDFATRDDSLGPLLIEKGFKAIGFVPGLYRKFAEVEVDVMLSRMSLSKDESEPFQPWVHDDVSTRDFTICALYCDYRGKVFDPTGRGLDDVKKKQLATVVDPNLLFQTDPICMLRGLKYISRGFIPTDEVAKAIRAWAPEPQAIAKYISHMAAVMRKLLRTNSQILGLLDEYDLKEKFLSLFTDRDYRDIQAQLTPKKALNFLNAATGKTVELKPASRPMQKPRFVTLTFAGLAANQKRTK